MGYKVIFSTQANRDLGQIVCFLAQKNPAAAERLGYALLERAMSVATLPHLGAPVRQRSDIRRIVLRPWFLIYYRIDEKSQVVEIVRIWDGRQNPAGFGLK
jgi:plasmid stabilization system protein ParE